MTFALGEGKGEGANIFNVRGQSTVRLDSPNEIISLLSTSVLCIITILAIMAITRKYNNIRPVIKLITHEPTEARWH